MGTHQPNVMFERNLAILQQTAYPNPWSTGISYNDERSRVSCVKVRTRPMCISDETYLTTALGAARRRLGKVGVDLAAVLCHQDQALGSHLDRSK